jgi:thiol-disulfide isomerase/thioredoxin
LTPECRTVTLSPSGATTAPWVEETRMRHFDVVGVVLLAGAASIASGCNGITGSGDLTVINGGTGASAGTAAGAGGAGGAGSESSSSTGMPMTQCVYPTAGLGFGVGKVVPPHHTWKGFPDNSLATSTPVDVAFDDYYDCDGSKGVNALLVDTSALWCGACQEAASHFTQEIKSSWAALGIHVITLMVDDAQPGQPATIKTVTGWKTTYKLDNSTVVVDPGFTFAPPGETTIGLPVEVIVDPRTMKIVDSQEGYSGDYSALIALAKKNAVK